MKYNNDDFKKILRAIFSDLEHKIERSHLTFEYDDILSPHYNIIVTNKKTGLSFKMSYPGMMEIDKFGEKVEDVFMNVFVKELQVWSFLQQDLPEQMLKWYIVNFGQNIVRLCAIASNPSITEYLIVMLLEKENDEILHCLQNNKFIDKRIKLAIEIKTGIAIR